MSTEGYSLDQLNPEQREAVKHFRGPALVIAGPGSGKTRVLTHRVANLISRRGVDPSQILAVTFTNKAAREMKRRVGVMTSKENGLPTMGTFHAVCLHIIRNHTKKAGFDPRFTIVDRGEQRSILEKHAKRLGTDIRTLTSLISRMKNVEGYEPKAEMREVFRIYQAALKERNAMDFDDMILGVQRLFEDESLRRRYAKKFQFILVDEYQDTNRPQYRFLHGLAKEHRNLFVVGDEDQSIFGFRGADIGNIMNFQDDFSDAVLYRLEQNYRSTGSIVAAASGLISTNRTRLGKELRTENDLGKPLTIREFDNERNEAEFIARMVKKGSRAPSDYLVLYRTNAQSRAIEDTFRRMALPFRIVGGSRFYERKEVKDLLAYLRLIANSEDNTSFQRAVNTPPRGIGRTTLGLIRERAKENGCFFFEAVNSVPLSALKPSAGVALSEFVKLVHRLTEFAKEHNALEVLEQVIESTSYRAYVNRLSERSEGGSREENIDALRGAVRDFCIDSDSPTVEEYVHHVSLFTELEDESEKDGVNLMTIHTAKGLEFPVVIVTGMEEGIFPHKQSRDPTGLEEERRLFYVAITRAMEEVWLTCSRSRYIRRNTTLNPSSFLGELPEKWVDWEERKRSAHLLSPAKYSFEIGRKVRHPKFGNGVVIGSSDGKVDVLFDAGKKTLMQEYARLELLR